MKKNLLLMMLCCPVVLAAQNGVTVSNLTIDAGTVTFNVSWNGDAMPVSLWSDTVWVFVDYNKNGVMERLPVTSATASAGTVTKIPNNDKGVWVAGNARTQGSFSATVQLVTTVTEIAGACAYASNYPPVGEYTATDKIEFTGTPMYEISLTNSGGETTTVESGGTFLLPCDYTLTSFIDATGVPGTMKESCTAPGSTVNFTAFNPCSNATTGDYWYLTDTRESNNTQTYKVKLMADGRIWMVQDLKFGDKCNKTTFSGSDGSDQTGKVTTLTDKTYYGDCTNIRNSSTPANRGYLYDWAAALNKSGAYSGSSSIVGCSGTGSGATGTNPGACQGICPIGWHIPTGNTNGEFSDAYTKFRNAYGCAAYGCWGPSSQWEGESGGLLNCNGTWREYDMTYISSTHSNGGFYELTSYSSAWQTSGLASKCMARSLRCIMNY
jgi:uncharacterized protein (TIGR02145 family)